MIASLALPALLMLGSAFEDATVDSAVDAAGFEDDAPVVREIRGDVLLIDRVARSGNTAMPRRGATMDQVRAQFGEPTQQFPAVGVPPITRWVYPEISVYFEGQWVINSVVNRSSSKERGPRQP